MTGPYDVLVVEDDHDLREALVSAMEGEGLRVRAPVNARAVLEAAQAGPPAVALVDLVLGSAFGEAGDIVRELRARAGVPVVLISGARELGRQASRLGAVATVAKPFAVRDLLAAVLPYCGVAARKAARRAPSARPWVPRLGDHGQSARAENAPEEADLD